MSEDRFEGLETAYKEYTVYDQHYEKIGRVDDLFVDESDKPEYIGVKTGLLGMKSTLVPIDIARVNDRRKLIEIAADKDAIEKAPTFDTNKEITPDYENQVHSYFGLERPHASSTGGGYGDYYRSDPRDDESLRQQVDTEYGERAETSGRSTGGSTASEERLGDSYDTSSSRPAESLDIPLDEPERREPVRHEPVSREPVRHEPVSREPISREPERSEPERSEPERSEPVRRDPVKIERGDSIAGSSRTTDTSGSEGAFVNEEPSGDMRVHKRIRRG